MKPKTQGRRIFSAAFSALALGGLIMTGPLPARADTADTATVITAGDTNTTTYADDGDKGKGKKIDKGGTAPIIIGPPIIVHDPPKAPPKKDK